MDAHDWTHLRAWLASHVAEGEQAATLDAIQRSIREEPDLISRGLSWREIADRGRA